MKKNIPRLTVEFDAECIEGSKTYCTNVTCLYSRKVNDCTKFFCDFFFVNAFVFYDLFEG